MTNQSFSRKIRRSIATLQASGYTAVPTKLGEFDILALSSTDVVLVKVCQGKPPWAGAIAELQAVTCPPNCRRLIHRWSKRKRLPDVKVL